MKCKDKHASTAEADLENAVTAASLVPTVSTTGQRPADQMHNHIFIVVVEYCIA